MSDEQHGFFVYGTLLSGFSNARRLGRNAYFTPAYLSGYALLDNGWFPYAVKTSSSADAVVGEFVLAATASYSSVLRDLDALEGFQGTGRANHYDRVQEQVVCEDGSVVTAWVYAAGSRVGRHLLTLPRIASGSWRQHEEMRAARAEFGLGEDD